MCHSSLVYFRYRGMEEIPKESASLFDSLIVGSLIAFAGVLAIEFGLSAAVLEIVMGVFARNVIHIWAADWVDFIADIGLITLMFIAGFEVDLPMLRKNLGKSTTVGAISFIIPFAGAYGISLLLNMDHSRAVIFAIAMSTTSLALVFPTLKERGMLTSVSGQFLLSSAMIVDILSVLALMVFFIQPSFALLYGAIGVSVIFLLAPRLSRILFGRWRGNLVEMEVRFILFALLALMFIAQLSHVHAALTGFVFGAVMGSILRKHYQVEAKLRNIVFSFFAPVFFFRAGTQMDLSQVDLMDFFLFLIFTPVAFLLKYAGSYYPFKWFKCPESKFGAILFNYRLSFAIVAALYGLESGLINAGEYSALMCIILVTSLGTALLLRFRPDIEHPPSD